MALDSAFFLCGVLEYEQPENAAAGWDGDVRQRIQEYLESQHIGAWTAVYRSGCLAILWEGTAAGEVLERKSILQSLAHQAEKTFGIRVLLGIGEMAYGPEHIPRAFAQGHQAAEFKLWNPPDRVILFRELDEGKTMPPILTASLLEHWDPDYENQIFCRLEACMSHGYSLACIRQVREAYELSMEAAERYQFHKERKRKDFSTLWNIFELHRELEAVFTQLTQASEEEMAGGSRIAGEIIRYTLDHITEDIDLNALAYRFGKTPGYIGKLFKQNNQMGFNEFITQERIKLAQKLLQNPSLTVQKVSKMCGYYNSKYFSVVFKKVTGMSPKAYQIQEQSR